MEFDSVTFEVVDPEDPRAVTAVAAYLAELDARFPNGFEASASISAASHETRPPHGLFLLALFGSAVVGCGAFKFLSPGVCEFKRMWIAPSFRGRGLGRRLLSELESHARAVGFQTFRLDTSAHLPEARRLYENNGYREIDAYNDNPYAAHWFEKA